MENPQRPAAPPAASESSGGSPPKSKRSELQALREKLIHRLLSEGAGDLAKPLQSCGEPLRLVCVNCGDGKATEVRCRKRWCPVCQPLVAREKLKRWEAAVKGLQWPLFVTLTAQNSPDPESLRMVKEAWAKFRRRKLIREKCQGGVATFEVTNNGKGWHPHIHAIMDCRWLSLHTREPKRGDPREVVLELCQSAKGELSNLWADQLKQKIAIVDVARIAGEEVTAYVLKYCAKPAELLALDGDLAPIIRVLRKTRMLAGFGSLFPLPALDAELEPAKFCECCGDSKTWIPESIVTFSFNKHHDQNIGTKGRRATFQKL